MAHICEYFPRRVWVALLLLASLAAACFFVPPSVTRQFGFSIVHHIIALGTIEFGLAVSIGAIVVSHRPADPEFPEWRFDP
jgi:hypothetical protein